MPTKNGKKKLNVVNICQINSSRCFWDVSPKKSLDNFCWAEWIFLAWHMQNAAKKQIELHGTSRRENRLV